MSGRAATTDLLDVDVDVDAGVRTGFNVGVGEDRGTDGDVALGPVLTFTAPCDFVLVGLAALCASKAAIRLMSLSPAFVGVFDETVDATLLPGPALGAAFDAALPFAGLLVVLALAVKVPSAFFLGGASAFAASLGLLSNAFCMAASGGLTSFSSASVSLVSAVAVGGVADLGSLTICAACSAGGIDCAAGNTGNAG